MLDRRRLRAPGAARPVHLLADALSLRKLAGEHQSYVNCIKQNTYLVRGQTMRERVSSFRSDRFTDDHISLYTIVQQTLQTEDSYG